MGTHTMPASYSYLSSEKIERQLCGFFGTSSLVLDGILRGKLLGPWKEQTQDDPSCQVGLANMQRYWEEVMKYVRNALMVLPTKEVAAVLVEWAKDDERGAVAKMWIVYLDRELWVKLRNEATSDSTVNVFAGVLCELVVQSQFVAIGHSFNEGNLVAAQAKGDVFAVTPVEA